MFENKLHSCFLRVNNGVVLKCTIDGSDKMSHAADKLTGCRHMVPDLLNALEKENISISAGEIYNFF
jgi:hypothetical protein